MKTSTKWKIAEFIVLVVLWLLVTHIGLKGLSWEWWAFFILIASFSIINAEYGEARLLERQRVSVKGEIE